MLPIHRLWTMNGWVKLSEPVKKSFPSSNLNDWVNEWNYCTGIFSTSPLPVWHHRSRTRGARWLWHLCILATDSILLACRSENKTTFMDTRFCAVLSSLKPLGNDLKREKAVTVNNMLTASSDLLVLSDSKRVSRCMCVFFVLDILHFLPEAALFGWLWGGFGPGSVHCLCVSV